MRTGRLSEPDVVDDKCEDLLFVFIVIASAAAVAVVAVIAVVADVADVADVAFLAVLAVLAVRSACAESVCSVRRAARGLVFLSRFEPDAAGQEQTAVFHGGRGGV